MHIINISEAKAQLSSLIEKVLAGEEVLIGKAGKPVAKLVRYERSDKKLIPGAIFMGVALLFGILFLYPILMNSDLNSNLVPLIFVGGFIAIFVAIGFTMVLNAFLDLNAHEPEVVEGAGSKITRRKSSGKSSRTVYYYIIGDHEFEVPQKAYPALLEGMSYKAYYMPRTKHLLSIEPVSVPEQDRP